MANITLDFETYFDDAYSLSKITTIEYIKDPRFYVHSLAYSVDGGEYTYIRDTDNISDTLAELFPENNDNRLIAHNAYFDALILTQHYGLRAGAYTCTASLGRAVWPHNKHSLKNMAEFLWPHDNSMRKGTELVNFKGVQRLTAAQHDVMKGYNVQDVNLCWAIYDTVVNQGGFPQSELDILDATIRMYVEPKFVLDTELLRQTRDESEREQAEAIQAAFNFLVSHPYDKHLHAQLALTHGFKAVQQTKHPVFTHELQAVDKTDPRKYPTKKAFNAAYRATFGMTPPKADSRIFLSSNDKFAYVLENLFNIRVPMKISPTTGKPTYALGKSDVAYQELQRDYPELQILWTGRAFAKSNIARTRAERLLSIAKATGGLLPVPLKYYGAHCVTGDTEVLTQTGWQRLDQWQGGVIAQVDDNLNVTFEHADLFKGPEADHWVHIKNHRVDCKFTLGHNMPYLTDSKKPKLKTMQAGEMYRRAAKSPGGKIQLPAHGVYQGNTGLTAEQMRVIVMCQADGSWAKGGMRLKFTKQRKIDRCLDLLSAQGLPHTVGQWASGHTAIRIKKADVPEWLKPCKQFGKYLLDSDLAAREAFLDELPLWDGSIKVDAINYCTTDKTNADWVQLIAHVSGRKVSLTSEAPSKNCPSTMYIVRFLTRGQAGHFIEHSKINLCKETHTTYCTVTRTGKWLARANGKVFVTHNTGRYSGFDRINVQNFQRGSNHRLSICAPENFKVHVADSSNVEGRLAAWFCGDTEKLQFIREGGDIYKRLAGRIYNKPAHDVNKQERQVGKAGELGLGYGMGKDRFRDYLNAGPMGMPPVYFDDEYMYGSVVEMYRELNWPIKRMWDELTSAIYDMTQHDTDYYIGANDCVRVMFEQLVLPNGMRLHYPRLRYTEDGWLYADNKRLFGGKLLENIIQALARILICDQMMMIDGYAKLHGGTVNLQVHDEIVVLMPYISEHHSEQFQAEIERLMKIPSTWCADAPIDSEGGFADNYSK